VYIRVSDLKKSWGEDYHCPRHASLSGQSGQLGTRSSEVYKISCEYGAIYIGSMGHMREHTKEH
jgi:hypothetical protein